jgi:hypothetical protein
MDSSGALADMAMPYRCETAMDWGVGDVHVGLRWVVRREVRELEGM